ncbi:MAG: helix-turn-helix domain-containing protein [Bifidobacterium sp.]|nr:helix-turn-helix domain-containing protein [Bifidobacterium sp.]MCH4209773.1 helix-turn-helix domain-containing protein [Bifidobacterium sp.]MCI1224564.1 helix-turn-helix domain-containing protein [Bifidobacterium sp.]
MKNAPERADGCSGSCIDDHAADTVHDDTGPAGTEELHMAPAQHWSLTETAQARIESVAFEALLQGLGDGRVAALLRILGWPCQFKCFALAGTPKSSYSGTRAAILRAVHDLGGDGCLIGRCGSICVAIIEIRSAVTPEVTCTAALGAFDDARPVCLGSAGANASGASRVTRGVLNALRACPAVSPLPRPMRADDVLPERALLGDDDARDELVAVVYRSLLSDNADDPTLDTVSAFIQSGGSLDATARELNVHPNTVRYRLKRAAETTGWDATNPREAYVLQTAITLGRVRDGRRSS